MVNEYPRGFFTVGQRRGLVDQELSLPVTTLQPFLRQAILGESLRSPSQSGKRDQAR